MPHVFLISRKSIDASFQVFFRAQAPSGAVPDAHQYLLPEREESVSTRDLRHALTVDDSRSTDRSRAITWMPPALGALHQRSKCWLHPPLFYLVDAGAAGSATSLLGGIRAMTSCADNIFVMRPFARHGLR